MGDLTETAIRAAIKTAEKPQKLFDGQGLYLLIAPPNSPGWRLKFYFPARKERLMSLGTYPQVSLKRVREKRDEARRQIADGIDPAVTRKAKRLAQAETFEGIAAEWLELQRKSFSVKTMPMYGLSRSRNVHSAFSIVFTRNGWSCSVRVSA